MAKENEKILVVNFYIGSQGEEGSGGDGIVSTTGGATSSISSNPFQKVNRILHPISNYVKHVKNEGKYAYAGKEIAKQVYDVGSKVVKTSVNRYFELTEDYKRQNNLNNVMTSINKAKGLAGSVISGATAGSLAGPGGAAIGAAISLGVYATNSIIDYENKMATYHKGLNATRIETAFNSARAGLYNGGRGTEN